MLIYRKIQTPDWPRILDIQHECYKEETRETLAALQSRWTISPESCFVAEHETALIGYALSHPWKNNVIPALDTPLHGLPEMDLLYVHDVAISKSGRGCGAAALLVNALIAHANACNLNSMALTAVQGSSPFWEQYGFKGVHYSGDLKGYGGDAAYMKRTLRHL